MRDPSGSLGGDASDVLVEPDDDVASNGVFCVIGTYAQAADADDDGVASICDDWFRAHCEAGLRVFGGVSGRTRARQGRADAEGVPAPGSVEEEDATLARLPRRPRRLLG